MCGMDVAVGKDNDMGDPLPSVVLTGSGESVGEEGA
eukprot:CAMPEP_0169412104 /NCGR_PEP_ID=MMETSP1017-20121227/60648_1 /TAXON_ID=342587 /ORGANISM="Karlodinium micrum, Strain CCMP2283" /LENGTH=35 /DNA_ID= /DNA_START= /DNA_END= /DNA_ORIENTATION=